MSKRWLVTGGRGFIGKNLFNYLNKHSSPPVVVDIKDGPRYDLRYPFQKQITSQWDVCVHLAAMTDVRFSLENPAQVIDNNLAMTLNCIEGMNRGMFKTLVFTSSASAHDCQNPYLASKHACEATLTAYKNSYGLDIKILRLPNIYGPFSQHKTSVIPAFIKACFENKPLYINGDGEQTRVFAHVDEVCRSIHSCVNSDNYKSQTFACSINGLAEMVQRISSKQIGKVPTLVHKDAIKGEVKYAGDPTLMLHGLDDFMDRLEETFKWFAKEVYND